jgi:hypothetical protein
MRNIRTYTELISIPTFEERFEYCKISARVGDQTFGGHRYLNQLLYKMPEWKSVRREVMIRDNGYDLAHEDYPIDGSIYIHHLNPITIDDIQNRKGWVFNPEYLISVSFKTHNAIHYGDESLLSKAPIVRTRNDTCPWR